MLIVVS